MEDLPPELSNLKEDEEIMIGLENESYIKGQEENLNNLDCFR